jgi:hypothetical protein
MSWHQDTGAQLETVGGARNGGVCFFFVSRLSVQLPAPNGNGSYPMEETAKRKLPEGGGVTQEHVVSVIRRL